MQIDHQPTKILLVGKSGSGKTTYMLRFVENAGGYSRIFIFDHKLEFQKRLGIVPCQDTGELVEILKNDENQGKVYLSYYHGVDFPGDAQSGFEYFCEWVFEICRAMAKDGKKSLFVCDEVNRFSGTQKLGWEFTQLIEDGRLQGLDFIGTAHAANQISNRLKLQLTEIVALKTIGEIPLSFLEECGFDGEEVSKLDRGEFICLNLDHDEFTRGRLFIPDRQKMPSEEKELTDRQELPSSAENENNLTGEKQNALPQTPTDFT